MYGSAQANRGWERRYAHSRNSVLPARQNMLSKLQKYANNISICDKVTIERPLQARGITKLPYWGYLWGLPKSLGDFSSICKSLNIALDWVGQSLVC